MLLMKKNARVPLKYSDPELEIEQKRLEKMQEYYK